MLVVWNILHVSLVVVADLLDADVVLGLDVGFGGGVGPGQSHHAGDVLEVLLVLHFDLLGETPLVSGRLIKKRAGGRLESHRNFTLVHWWDNEGSLDGNIAKGGFELRHTRSHQVIRLYAGDRDVIGAHQHETWFLHKKYFSL